MNEFDYLALYSSLESSDLNWFLLKEDSDRTRLLIYFPNDLFVIFDMRRLTTTEIVVFLKRRLGRPKTIFKEFPYEHVSMHNLSLSIQPKEVTHKKVIAWANTYRAQDKCRKKYNIVIEPFNNFTDLVLKSNIDYKDNNSCFPILRCLLPSSANE